MTISMKVREREKWAGKRGGRGRGGKRHSREWKGNKKLPHSKDNYLNKKHSALNGQWCLHILPLIKINI